MTDPDYQQSAMEPIDWVAMEAVVLRVIRDQATEEDRALCQQARSTDLATYTALQHRVRTQEREAYQQRTLERVRALPALPKLWRCTCGLVRATLVPCAECEGAAVHYLTGKIPRLRRT